MYLFRHTGSRYAGNVVQVSDIRQADKPDNRKSIEYVTIWNIERRAESPTNLGAYFGVIA
jgi:hypothetical protein